VAIKRRLEGAIANGRRDRVALTRFGRWLLVSIPGRVARGKELLFNLNLGREQHFPLTFFESC
jgi:hypothetical protein